MERFILFAALCLATVFASGYTFYTRLELGGAQAKVHGSLSDGYPKGREGVVPELPRGPVDPAANNREKVLRRIEDRNNKIFNAKLGLQASASEFVASLDSIRGIVQAFNIEMDIYRSYDHGRIAAITGQTEVIPAPHYPTASMAGATNSARASRRSFKMALDRYEIDVRMIMNSFYEEFADLIGHEEASKVPPPPVTSMDAILDQAIQLERDFDRALQTAIRGG
jgi:hypothetical protein